MKQSSHKLDSVGIRFDAVRLVTNAGLTLPATLGDRLGCAASYMNMSIRARGRSQSRPEGPSSSALV
jgi:hypothetical protein